MSRIYEALRVVEAERSANGARDSDNLGAMDILEQRRSRRWELDVPLTVYGHGPDGSTFYQEADAENASADGGLIVMRISVCEGQELLLINNFSSQEQLCRVVRVISRDAETTEVGVAFPSPNPKFWEFSKSSLPEEPLDEGF
jgi:hypothetical protein